MRKAHLEAHHRSSQPARLAQPQKNRRIRTRRPRPSVQSWAPRRCASAVTPGRDWRIFTRLLREFVQLRGPLASKVCRHGDDRKRSSKRDAFRQRNLWEIRGQTK